MVDLNKINANHDRYCGREVEEFRANGMAYILCNFFGASEAAMARDGKFHLQFTNRSADGLSEEKRRYLIDSGKSPEENMAIITAARAEQRWYQTKRSGDQFAPYVPAPVAETQADASQASGDGQQDAAA